jgi:hypothetical protein
MATATATREEVVQPAPLGGAPAVWSGARLQLAAHVGVTALTVLVATFIGPALRLHLPVGAVAILGVGAVAVELAPRYALAIAAAVGVLLLARLNAVYTAYHLVLVGTLFLARRRGWTLALALVVLAVIVPKTLFARHYLQPGVWNWLNEPSLAVAIFVSAYWWRETRRSGAPVPAGTRSSLVAWALLYFFPTHAANPLVLGPADLWRGRQRSSGAVMRGLALFVGKAAAFSVLRTAFPDHGYASHTAAALASMPRAALWGVVALNYLDLLLVLSGTADLAVVLARLYGWQLPFPFRFAVMAWNPVELWRRWGIYNRRFLLKLVYFPLGGNGPRRLLNVMLTFLASALVLHSGWFGSKYWEVGVGGWRDQSLYFLAQGAAVCGCLLFWRLIKKDPRADRELRWSWGRVPATVATQAMSALVHVIVLPQAVPLGARFRLIGRCLGLL